MWSRTISLVAVSAALACGAACGGGSSGKPPRVVETVDVLPTLSLGAGSPYFSVAGAQRVVMTRNVTGTSVADIDALLDQAKSAGSTVIRLHVIHGLGSGVTPAGQIDETWAASWDAVFDHARMIGLYVLPVFGVWADFNDGTPDLGFANWSMNPWNAANGGPASSPADLLQSGSTLRAGWLGWVGALVARWAARPNIAAWEVFSELDLAAGATEETAAALATDAAAAVRAADGRGRPVMTSLSSLHDWPAVLGSPAVDIVQVHAYAEQLDTTLIAAVAAKLTAYGKPVLIGESGLAAAAPTGNTATTAPNAPIAIKHAIWAGMVSGAMNARGLWWEDGYAIYEPPGLAFVTSYANAEAPAARFAKTVELAGVKPLVVAPSAGVTGAAIGNEFGVVGWFRAAQCASPGWDCTTGVAGASVTVTVPGTATTWLPVLYDPTSGSALATSPRLTQMNGQIVVPLPNLTDDVAFTLTPTL
jgi:Cellulase (glycosyl hydrolase family 5)